MPWFEIHFISGIVSSVWLMARLQPTYLEKMQSGQVTIEEVVALTYTVMVFSILPDIDHKISKISRFLHIAFLIILLGLYFKEIPLNSSSIVLIISIVLMNIYNYLYAKNHWTHRQFPHTFTFGILATIMLYLITWSVMLTLLWFFCFTLHLLLDCYIPTAIKKDISFWRWLFNRSTPKF